MQYLTIIFCLLLFSCRPSEKPNTSAVEEATLTTVIDDNFKSYLANFKKLELPLSVKGCTIRTNGLKQFDGTGFSKYAGEYELAYGQIPTNGNYVATITLGAADCYLPVLTTYTPAGKLITKETIAIGGCGAGCGFQCEEFMILQKDFSFYTSDTISIYECDSLGNETPGTYEHYVIYRKGKMLTNGKIEIGEEIKKML